MEATLSAERVVRTYLTISGLFTLAASVIWGVNTLFLLDAGLDIFEVFVANAAFTAGMVVFEIPTGVVADTAGRRRSFLLSAGILCAGTLAYVGIAAAGWGLVPFVVASVVLGIGFTFYSGAVEAWLVDALAATGYTGELDNVFARGAMISGTAMIVGSIGGGLLGGIDLAVPFGVRALLLATALVVGARSMFDLGFVPRSVRLADLPGESRAVLRTSIEFGWRQHSLRLLMLVSLVNGTFSMWGFYAWQPYFLDLLERDEIWITGVIAAAGAVASIAGNRVVVLAARGCRRRTTLLVASVVLGAAATLGVGLAGSFGLALAALLVANFATGIQLPVQQAFQHSLVPSQQRATVISFGSLLGSAGGIGGQLGLGYLARARSVAAGYVAGAAILVVTLGPLSLLRRRDDPADRFARAALAGADGACAAQGLPAVAAVDTAAYGHQPRALTKHQT